MLVDVFDVVISIFSLFLVEDFNGVVAFVSSSLVDIFDLAVADGTDSSVDAFDVLLTGDEGAIFLDNDSDLFSFVVFEASMVWYVVNFGVTADFDVTLCAGGTNSSVDAFDVVLTGDEGAIFVDNDTDLFSFNVFEASMVWYVVNFGVTGDSDLTLCS